MSFRNISSWAIRNPVPPIVLFIALTLMGIMAFVRMPVTADPDIDLPFAIVTVVQPGAAPSELETQVAEKVEAAVTSINGVEEVNTTVREGSATISVQFEIGVPIDRAINDVRDAVANIRSDLPEGILEPQVMRVDTADNAIAYFSASSTDMTLEELSWFVDDVVAKRLRTVTGLGDVERGGGVSREIRVILDPARMQSYGVTASQVNAQLRQTNVNAAGGRAEIAGSEQSVRVLGNARTAFELGNTPIAAGNGRIIRLTDIATVRDLYAEQRSLSTMNGRQVLSFGIKRAKGASDVAVYDEAVKELDKIRAENPKVQFEELFTMVNYTRSQFHSSMTTMIEGAVLAVVVVFLFLRDWRATIISAIAIPLSAIPTFWFMELLGFSLNQISLLALSLVAGVLVDDAIVEIENIVRHMRMGKNAYEASIDAADEIGLAVLATTMAIVAVFLPVGMMPGIAGQYFKNFGLTVVVAVLMSLAVARLISPMLAAYFLRPHGEQEHASGPVMQRYLSILRWSLRHRGVTMLAALAAFGATIGAFATLPFTFQPDIDFDYSTINIEMVPGTTLSDTERVTANVQTMLAHESDIVKSAFAAIRPGSANVFLSLHHERPISSIEFEDKWAPKLAAIPDARVNFRAQDGGGPPGSGRDIGITLGGSNPAVLERAAQTLVEEMRKMPELVGPRIAGDLQRPEIVVRPRMDLAASLGVTTSALSQTIRIATIGDIDQNSPKFSLSDRQVPIRVTLSENARRSLATLENLPVPTTSGRTVPLKSVAEITFGAGPTTIQRINQSRRLVVGADLATGVVSGDANKKIDALPIMKNLPRGVARINTGQSKAINELITNFIIALVSGIFLVFAVLLLLYRRVMPPLVNMGSLALAPLGAGIALHIAGMPTSMAVMIGMLMLLGIVAKNSILLVDFALEEIDRGVPRDMAIIEAGHKRAQPIVMTTFAMAAGMTPTALSLSGDGAWQQPMGVVVIGGLLVSTLLTLLIVPAAFSLALGVETRVGPWLSYYLTNGGSAGKHPDKPPRLFTKHRWWDRTWWGNRHGNAPGQPAE